jgi:photosystem II stability/assembly factor-like uncharacterized protein
VRRLALLLAAALALAGCGNDDAGGQDKSKRAKPSARLVDLSKTPYVNAFDIEPESGDFLLTTNRGFWRIDRESGKVKQLRGRIAAGGKRSTVGTFLFFLQAGGPGKLIGSGHPDQEGTLPSFLGFIETEDGGKTWKVISRLGDADLHKILLRHDRLYAFDAVLSAILISKDGGRNFEEHFTPRGLIIDFEVDPEDPEYIVAANEDELFRSEDSGERWRPLTTGEGIRLAWPAPDALYRAGKDGVVYRSEDRGERWQEVGKVDGEPYKFKAIGPEELYLALGDGTIVHTKDGGKTWDAVFTP